MYSNRAEAPPGAYQNPCDPSICCSAFCPNQDQQGDPMCMGMRESFGQYFDLLGWLNFFKVAVNLTGLIIVLTVLNKKTLSTAYSLPDQTTPQALWTHIQPEILPGLLPAWAPLDPTTSKDSKDPQPLAAPSASFCKAYALADFLSNLNRWNTLRTALFALNVVSPFAVTALMVRAKTAKELLEPFHYRVSTLKTVLDVVQFAVGGVVLLFVVLELVPFQQAMAHYALHTRGTLRLFWRQYEREYYLSLAAVLTSLCFGVALFGLKLVVFIVGYFPSKMCLQTMTSVAPSNARCSEEPGCMGAAQVFFDSYLTTLLALGMHGPLWEYIVKGSIPENEGPRRVRGMDWLRQAPDSRQAPAKPAATKRGFDIEDPDDHPRHSRGNTRERRRHHSPPRSQEMRSKTPVKHHSSAVETDEDSDHKKKKRKPKSSETRSSSHRSQKSKSADEPDEVVKKKKKKSSHSGGEGRGSAPDSEGEERKKPKKKKKPKETETEEGGTEGEPAEKKKKKRKKKPVE
eukprot:NODE_1144_length_1636_cov_32.886680_g1076_i0.p1 GENE.NODE_1144_length_1636_cov_32.886680_g1076_i0~~NODE_1144_length_1636_cov_32.886680_g1076_i0.p1  ORF type:complete len:515 (+),score=133.41 NODE_1144_length_1636_cov_32.886680_g1076_i0:68-1612(+)